jgi:hypothetical protein
MLTFLLPTFLSHSLVWCFNSYLIHSTCQTPSVKKINQSAAAGRDEGIEGLVVRLLSRLGDRTFEHVSAPSLPIRRVDGTNRRHVVLAPPSSQPDSS